MIFFPSSTPSSICFSRILQAIDNSHSLMKSASKNKNKNEIIFFEIKIEFIFYFYVRVCLPNNV
jgi:hypothetical protein